MRGLYITAAVLLILCLLMQVRLGGGAEYSAEGFRAWVRLGAFKLQVFPWKKKPKKEKPPKQEKTKKPKQKKQPAEPEPASQNLGGALDYVQAFLPIGLEALGGFAKKIQVDKLDLELTAGAPDPADAAMVYGQANAALAAVWETLTRALPIKDGRARTAVDFDAQSTTLYGTAALSMKLGQLLGLGLYTGIKALRAFLSVRRKNKKQQRKAA